MGVTIKMKKIMGLFALVTLMLVSLTSLVSAGQDFQCQFGSDFCIEKVWINGVTFDRANLAVRAERGQPLVVDVQFRGVGEVAERTFVHAFIGGYEYGDLSDSKGPFEVLPEVIDTKRLVIRLPEDLSANDQYTLFLEMYDDDQKTTTSFPLLLSVESQRHSVSIYDVILNPETNVVAGQPLFATVRLENLGDNVEDQVKVSVSIPNMPGVSKQSEFVDQLITEEDSDSDSVYTKRRATSTRDFVLFIPETVQEGNYEVVVRVEFNRGHDFEEQKFMVHVDGSTSNVQPTQTVMVNVDNNNQVLSAGESALYNVGVANLDQMSKVLTFELVGIGDWASSRFEPQTLVVGKDQTASVRVYVTPNDDVSTGVRTFMLRVKDGNNVVSEQTLSLELTQKENVSANWTGFKKVFQVGFIILLAILILVGIVILIKKLSEEKDESVENQTYY